MKLWEIIVAAAMLLVVIGWSLMKSDEPARFIVRWIITFLMLFGMFKIAVPGLMRDQVGAIVGILIIASCAIIIGITWASTWTSIGLSPLTNAFDGGDEPPEEKALYSMAETKRKRGQIQEAIVEIHKQLERFPNDCAGLMMLAEIQADNLQDVAAAQQTIDLLCEAHLDAPSQCSGALVAMADIHLQHGDVENARANLQRIVDRFPNTSFSQLAAQRLAQLENAHKTIAERGRSIVLQDRYMKHVGLQKTEAHMPTQADPSILASEYIAHLQKHPLDIETRQRLAVLYAEHFQRIDLAQMEFEQLIAQPNQTPKQISQHLNFLADWQVKLGHGDAARHTVQRIMQMFPKTALADAAAMRLANFGNELRGQQKSQATVKLGSYKKDLGLNRDY